MKISVAIPVYDAKLHIQIVRCLLGEQAIAYGLGDELQVSFMSSNSGIVEGRNQLAHEFMESDMDRLVFLDSDVSFEPGAIIKIAHQPVDFVGGCYRFKLKEECYPIQWMENQEIWANRMGLIEVQSLPTGFLSLSKNVFQAMKDKYPDRYSVLRNQNGNVKSFNYFQMPVVDGILYGEDYYFCREWKAMGGQIFLDPELNLTHWDFNPTPHPGHIGNWIKTEHQKRQGTQHENVS